jgi:hypothetical protein
MTEIEWAIEDWWPEFMFRRAQSLKVLEKLENEVFRVQEKFNYLLTWAIRCWNRYYLNPREYLEKLIYSFAWHGNVITPITQSTGEIQRSLLVFLKVLERLNASTDFLPKWRCLNHSKYLSSCWTSTHIAERSFVQSLTELERLVCHSSCLNFS